MLDVKRRGRRSKKLGRRAGFYIHHGSCKGATLLVSSLVQIGEWTEKAPKRICHRKTFELYYTREPELKQRLTYHRWEERGCQCNEPHRSSLERSRGALQSA